MQHDFKEHQKIQAELGGLFGSLGLSYKVEHRVCANLRADVYFVIPRQKERARYVIEIQRTQIALKEVKKRMAVYAAAGVGLIWIIPKQMRMYIELRSWEQYIVAETALVLFYDPKRERYYYVSDYLKCSVTRMRIVYHCYEMKHMRLLQKGACQLPFAKKDTRAPLVFAAEFVQWSRKRARYQGRGDLLQQLLYAAQITCGDIPRRAYTSTCKFLAANESVFWMQSVLYVLRVYKQLTTKELVAYCVDHRLLRSDGNLREVDAYVRHLKKHVLREEARTCS